MRHPLVVVLCAAVCAVAAGAQSYVAIAEWVADLPDHHNDPFDRLIVAQAQELRIAVVTADEQLSAYSVQIVAV